MEDASKRLAPLVLVLAALFTVLLVRPATAQLQVSNADGSMSLKFGVLGQAQAEFLDTATAKDRQDNLFIRRLRLLGGFKLNDKLTIFVDTDSPNLGKGNPDGTKNNADMYIQDFIVTYAFAKEFQIDSGLLLTAESYNHTQSAATLMAIDYGPYTFTESAPITARVGRDYGIQARGYLADDHIEYRGGVFQGARGVNNTNEFRYSGRLAFNVIGPQTTYTYRGTSLGKTQSLTIGFGFDHQQDFHSYGGDLFWDQPIPGGDGLTVQADYTQWDGGTFLTAIPKQKTTLLEVGYYAHAIKLLPYVQYAQENFDLAKNPDEKRTEVGIGYYINGHNQNIKFGYGKIDRDGSPKRNQIRLQYQVYAF
ncbi:MAG TPA: hypothetical protein VOA87_21275 [Thermoanaerobaculia bacterium]|nr:hypothetical protein [Thermoanaerobaculia bacterium]